MTNSTWKAGLIGLLLTLWVIPFIPPSPEGLFVALPRLETYPPHYPCCGTEGRKVRMFARPDGTARIPTYDGDIFMPYDRLREYINESLKSYTTRIVYIDADPNATFGDLMRAVSAARDADVGIALMTAKTWPRQLRDHLVFPKSFDY